MGQMSDIVCMVLDKKPPYNYNILDRVDSAYAVTRCKITTYKEPQVGIEPTTARLRIECSTPELLWRGNLMPWLGFEPRRLAAPPPQDGVSTSFTTRARISSIMSGINPPMPMLQPASKPHYEPILPTGATGLEPATSRVTVECSNQTELRPLNRTLPLHPAPTSCVSRRRRGDRIAPTGVEPVSAP